MSAALRTFAFDSHAVRVQTDAHGQPWFNASDVCNALEMGNPRQAIESHVDDDDVQKLDAIDSLGRSQQANHVNEPGLYALIFGSRKPAARAFKRWVTHEVLPSIRQSGRYEAPGTPASPGRGPWLSHEADALTSADRIFRAGLRSARSAGLPTARAIASAAALCQRKTGIDLLAELQAHDATQPGQAKGGCPGWDAHTPQRFWSEFASGSLPGFERNNGQDLPLPALTRDLYALYRHWCQRQGLCPAPLPQVVHAWQRHCGLILLHKRHSINGRKSSLQGFLTHTPITAARPPSWWGQQAQTFRAALARYEQEAAHAL